MAAAQVRDGPPVRTKPGTGRRDSAFEIELRFTLLSSCVIIYQRGGLLVIKSFKDKEAEKIFSGQFSSKLPQNIQRIALRKPTQITDYH
jgi:hypothetical protein